MSGVPEKGGGGAQGAMRMHGRRSTPTMQRDFRRASSSSNELSPGVQTPTWRIRRLSQKTPASANDIAKGKAAPVANKASFARKALKQRSMSLLPRSPKTPKTPTSPRALHGPKTPETTPQKGAAITFYHIEKGKKTELKGIVQGRRRNQVGGACCVARGAWRVARGAWRVVRGVWWVARGTLTLTLTPY